ncbi:hypothetical protein EVG20_g2895 [Dentipellis fragilis]|uniref:Uncharacterized protein n=1 Tax=Dentipellis fragilis TaxID=205917 RepID=A0A4Y9Z598_9AGAM|nr:hypothetical protein EVG20_g2895 [Dentipellis fragilis]
MESGRADGDAGSIRLIESLRPRAVGLTLWISILYIMPRLPSRLRYATPTSPEILALYTFPFPALALRVCTVTATSNASVSVEQLGRNYHPSDRRPALPPSKPQDFSIPPTARKSRAPARQGSLDATLASRPHWRMLRLMRSPCTYTFLVSVPDVQGGVSVPRPGIQAEVKSGVKKAVKFRIHARKLTDFLDSDSELRLGDFRL